MMVPVNPIWLIVVDGPHCGASRELRPDESLVLGPAGWAVADQEQGPLRHGEEGVDLPAEQLQALNLFSPRGKHRALPGDLVELGGQMLLVSAEPPGLPDGVEHVTPEQLAALAEDGTLAEWLEDLVGEGYEATDFSIHRVPDAGPVEADDEDEDDDDDDRLEDALQLEPIPIPRVFHSVYHGRPFPTCLICDADLLSSGMSYMIEKIFRGQRVILECAMCLGCASQMNCELSEKSRERLEAFGMELLQRPASLRECRLCGVARDATQGFNIISSAILDRVHADSWVLLCEPCTDRMEKLLSKKTQDVYRDFVTDNFPGVPSDIDVPRPIFF